MARCCFLNRTLIILVFVNIHVPFLESQILETTTENPLSVSSSREKASGINLGDSFFLQKLRQGNVGALKDFSSLRQTVTIPGNQQKHFTNFLQQQNPFHRFALWNMMQNGLVHGFPNSHAINRIGAQNPFQEYIDLLSEMRANSQDNGLSTTAGGTVDNNKRLPVTTILPLNTEIDSSIKPEVTNTQLGVLGIDQIKGVLRNTADRDSLKKTIASIAGVIKNDTRLNQPRDIANFGSNRKGPMGLQPVTKMAKNKNMDLKEFPKEFILQFVGDINSPKLKDKTDMSPRQTGLLKSEINGQVWMPWLPETHLQRNAQVVGNVFENNKFKTAPDMSAMATEGQTNGAKKSNALFPNLRDNAQPTGGFANSAGISSKNPITNMRTNIIDSLKGPTRKTFLQFVGDMTGAKLVNSENVVKKASGRISSLQSPSAVLQNKGNTVSISETGNPVDAGVKNIEGNQKTRSRDISSFIDMDFYLQKVGKLLADQLTPIDGALTAFNATNRRLFTANGGQIRRLAPTARIFVQPKIVAWPVVRSPIHFLGRTVQDINQNATSFRDSSNINSNQLSNRVKPIIRGISQNIPIRNNTNLETQELHMTNNIRSIQGTDKLISAAETTDEISKMTDRITGKNDNTVNDIPTIIDLLRTLTNKTSETRGVLGEAVNKKDINNLKSRVLVSSGNVPVVNNGLNDNDKNLMHDIVLGRNEIPNKSIDSATGMINDINEKTSINQNNIFQTNTDSTMQGGNIQRNTANVMGQNSEGMDPNMRGIIQNSSGMRHRLRDMRQRMRVMRQNAKVMMQIKNGIQRNTSDMRQTFNTLQMAKDALLTKHLQNNLQQTEERKEVRTSSMQDKHRDFVAGMKTKMADTQRNRFPFDGLNETNNRTNAKIGTETGFILVNKLFIADNTNENLNSLKKNNQTVSQMKTVVGRKETDPRTGEIVNIITEFAPSKDISEDRTAKRQSVTPEC